MKERAVVMKNLFLGILKALAFSIITPWKLGLGYFGPIWVVRPDELFFSSLLECNVTVVFLNLTLPVWAAWNICSQETCVGWEQLSMNDQLPWLSHPWGLNTGEGWLHRPMVSGSWMSPFVSLQWYNKNYLFFAGLVSLVFCYSASLVYPFP